MLRKHVARSHGRGHVLLFPRECLRSVGAREEWDEDTREDATDSSCATMPCASTTAIFIAFKAWKWRTLHPTSGRWIDLFVGNTMQNGKSAHIISCNISSNTESRNTSLARTSSKSSLSSCFMILSFSI